LPDWVPLLKVFVRRLELKGPTVVVVFDHFFSQVAIVRAGFIFA